MESFSIDILDALSPIETYEDPDDDESYIPPLTDNIPSKETAIFSGKYLIPPVRCYTCGKVIGDLSERMQHLVDSGLTIEAAFNELNVKRYCCRMNLMSPMAIPLGAYQSHDELNRQLQTLTVSDTTPQYRSIGLNTPISELNREFLISAPGRTGDIEYTPPTESLLDEEELDVIEVSEDKTQYRQYLAR